MSKGSSGSLNEEVAKWSFAHRKAESIDEEWRGNSLNISFRSGATIGRDWQHELSYVRRVFIYTHT